MKVAICLSGLTRCLHYSWPIIYFNLLKNFKNSFDVFIHTWDIDHGGMRDYFTMNSVPYEDKKKYIEENISPKKYLIESQFDFIKSRTIRLSTCMCYSLYTSNQLKKEYELENNFKYDLVIRSRMDVIYDSPMLDYEIYDSLNNDIIYVGYWAPEKYFPHKGVYPDTFAFASSKNMDFYSSIYELEQTGCGSAEWLLTRYLTENNKTVKYSSLQMKKITEYENRVFKAESDYS